VTLQNAERGGIQLTGIVALVVDALPGTLWSLGNLYQVFGRSIHFCTNGAQRTIEVDGLEVAAGRKERPVTEFEMAGKASRLWRFDLGWIGVCGLVAVLVIGAKSRRTVGRPRSLLSRATRER